MKHATNAASMRASNRKLILNLIRLGPISRVELAEKTQLTRATITLIVDEMIEAGLVEPVSVVDGNSLGRKRTQLAICRNARYAFGVNIRRSRTYVGVVNLHGEILAHREIPGKNVPADEMAAAISSAVMELRRELMLENSRILGIGISAPGPADYKEGIILNPPNFPGWRDVPICRLLTEATGYDTVLEKDTNARALEEQYFGAAQHISSFMLVQVHEGVGSGVMIRDKLYRGSHGMGSEIGHTTICFDGPVCSCGNRGCLENYFHLPTLLKGSDYDSWDTLAAHADEPAAASILDRAAEYLSAALVNAINLYDLEKVILTGDVAHQPEPLLERLNPMLRQRVLSDCSVHDIPVIASSIFTPVRTGAMAMLHKTFQE